MSFILNILYSGLAGFCLYLFFDGGAFHTELSQWLPAEDLKVIYLVVFAILALYLLYAWVKFSVKLILKIVVAVVLAGLFYYFVYQ